MLCALAAVVQAYPLLADAGIYDRVAIDHGQWWRLATGNLVHLSDRHLGADVLALLALGGLAEQRLGWKLVIAYLVAAISVGAAVYQGVPNLRYFGGLSGVVNATLVILALDHARQGAPRRQIWRLVLAAVAVKLAIEFTVDQTFLTATGDEPFIPVPLSHLAGAMAGVLFHTMRSGWIRMHLGSSLASVWHGCVEAGMPVKTSPRRQPARLDLSLRLDHQQFKLRLPRQGDEQLGAR